MKAIYNIIWENLSRRQRYYLFRNRFFFIRRLIGNGLSCQAIPQILRVLLFSVNASRLYVESYVEDVSILHNIFLSFHSQLSMRLCTVHPAQRN